MTGHTLTLTQHTQHTQGKTTTDTKLAVVGDSSANAQMQREHKGLLRFLAAFNAQGWASMLHCSWQLLPQGVPCCMTMVASWIKIISDHKQAAAQYG